MPYIRYIPRNTKKCSKCDVIRDRSEFYNYIDSSDGLHSQCKKCMSSYDKKWRENNPEKDRQRNKNWRDNNPDREKEHTRKWRSKNINKVRELAKKNYHKNKQVRVIRASARKRDIGLLPKEVTEHISWCKNQLCFYCGGPGGAHDHVVPHSRGGLTEIENLVPTCTRCNSSKGSKTPQEWTRRWYMDL